MFVIKVAPDSFLAFNVNKTKKVYYFILLEFFYGSFTESEHINSSFNASRLYGSYFAHTVPSMHQHPKESYYDEPLSDN